MKPLFNKFNLGLLIYSIGMPVQAYQQIDVEQVAPPSGEVAMLRGYNSRTGALTNVCLKPVPNLKGHAEAVNPDGTQSFEYINTVAEMMEAAKLDVAAKLKVSVGLGSGSASVNVSRYKKMESSVSTGAMWAHYEDMEAPVFANPAAKYQLTDEAKKVLEHANKLGKPQKFENFCGDMVVIGLQSGRYAEGVVTNRSESNQTEQEKHLKVAAAISYMRSKASVSVETNDSSSSMQSTETMQIDFRTSGDVEMQGISGIGSFKRAFRKFQKQPREDSRSLKYMFIIAMPDLVGKEQFSMGLSSKRLRKVNTILRGLSVIQGALRTAKIDVGRYGIKKTNAPKPNALRNLRKEHQYLKAKFKRSGGCMNKWSKECQNLYERFQRYKYPADFKQRESAAKRFIKTAYASKTYCASGYPVSTPTGKRLCKRCDIAKEPKFIKGQEGRCNYITLNQPAKNSTRLWAHDLKIQESKQSGEAGMYTQVLTYPDKCKSKGKECGQKAANRLCKSKNFGKATAFKIWDWPGSNPLHKERFYTQYANGKKCSANKNGFTPNRCRTFKYIDCKNLAKPKPKGNRKIKNKRSYTTTQKKRRSL